MFTWIGSNWLSLVVAAFLIGMMLYGHYRGFLKMALSVAAVVITVLIARMILPLAASIIHGTRAMAGAEDYRVKLLAFILLVILVWIILRLVIKVLDLFTKIPVIHGLNQIAGAVMGLFMGLMILWIFALVLIVFKDVPWAASVIERIAQSRFLSFIFSNNLLYVLLRSVFKDAVHA